MTSMVFIFMPAFLPGRVAGEAALGGLGIPHGQQQIQIIPLVPHQDGTKQGLRCSHSTSLLFSDIDRKVFEMTEKTLSHSVRMSENIG